MTDLIPPRIKRPNYVANVDGGMEIYCKICGTCVAGMQDVSRGRSYDKGTRQWVEQLTRQFRRYPNYTEIKIEFEDGSFHVTNGCRKCLTEGLEVETLHELHQADMDVEEKQGNKLADVIRNRKPVRVVAIVTDGSGIV